MDHIEFLYLSFFITVGGYILGFLSGWFSNSIFSAWHENAAYAKSITHPEMLDEDGHVLRDELTYLTFGDDDDMMDDEDE